MKNLAFLLLGLVCSYLSTSLHASVITSPTIDSNGEFVPGSFNDQISERAYYSVFSNISADGKASSVIDNYVSCSLSGGEFAGRCDIGSNGSATIEYQFSVNFTDVDGARAALGGSSIFSLFFDWSFGYQSSFSATESIASSFDRRSNSTGSLTVGRIEDGVDRGTTAVSLHTSSANREISSISSGPRSGVTTVSNFGTLEVNGFDISKENIVTVTTRHNSSIFASFNNNTTIDDQPPGGVEARIVSFLDPIIYTGVDFGQFIQISDISVTSSFIEEGEKDDSFGQVQQTPNQIDIFSLPTRPSTSSSIPEPGTLAILALGLAGLFTRRR